MRLTRNQAAKVERLAGVGPGRATMYARLILPWPPSVNHYYRHVGSRVLVSREGRMYRQTVQAVVMEQGRPRVTGRLAVTVYARPPDRRIRDLDNTLKSLLDALAGAEVYADDSQIDRLVIERRLPKPGGELLVVIESIVGGPTP